MVLVLYAVFHFIIKVQIKEAPFLLYLMSAIFPWSFFSDSLLSSSSSLIDNKNLIKESNLPHYIVPISIVLTNAVVFLPSLFILISITLFVSKGLPVFIIFLPAILFIHLIITIALSIIVSILYVKFRDIKYISETLLFLFFYSIPVFYSIDLIKTTFSPFLFKIYIYNPFLGICNLYRLMLLKGFYRTMQETDSLFSAIVMPAFFATAVSLWGIFLYKRNKAKLNDYISY